MKRKFLIIMLFLCMMIPLLPKDNVKASVKSYLDGHKLEQAYIFGGDGVIGKNILGR